ncbi:hypothetical protein HJG60_008391 [Phyllostomus discolor]|uniref:Uncharacterized protein n=1 Tax=Phyllostomus discolor TaxID=89673 RepID=A0A834DJM7_9CHIR|nr:hypothetical protein HJG60_008391 [Phyllostomus discolor]
MLIQHKTTPFPCLCLSGPHWHSKVGRRCLRPALQEQAPTALPAGSLGLLQSMVHVAAEMTFIKGDLCLGRRSPERASGSRPLATSPASSHPSPLALSHQAEVLLVAQWGYIILLLDLHSFWTFLPFCTHYTFPAL